MALVKQAGEQYICLICGNEVEVTKAGGGELVCCGRPMNIKEKSLEEFTKEN